tara:strand:- start:28 stop:549 length:522 start_codon:yes stop_codon:yes gene_type:complete
MKNTKTIYENLFEAKKHIGKISKDSKNPFFKSKYFDINGLLNAVEPVLAENGLLLLQPIEDGKVITKIINVADGVTIQSEMTLPALTDAQKLGSAITYFRRYTAQSLLGLQAEDDDANLASRKPKTKQLDWLAPTKVNAAIKYAKENNKSVEDLKRIYKIRPEELTLILDALV